MASENGKKSCHKHDYVTSKEIEKKRTKNRLDLGSTSKNIKAKPTARPIQRMMSPRTRRMRADIGVKFPNALERRKRGKASCSIALKQYSFCAWKRSGICANNDNSACDLGSCVLFRGKLWIRSAGGR